MGSLTVSTTALGISTLGFPSVISVWIALKTTGYSSGNLHTLQCEGYWGWESAETRRASFDLGYQGLESREGTVIDGGEDIGVDRVEIRKASSVLGYWSWESIEIRRTGFDLGYWGLESGEGAIVDGGEDIGVD